MIISTEELGQYRGRPLVMVDGGFDPLHIGHLKYFEEAKRLGVPVLVNVQSDQYLTDVKKRPPLLPEAQRAELLKALRTIDYVHVCHTSTADVLERLVPKYYAKGADWREKGLPQKELEICQAKGIEIVYLDTILDSSTNLSKKYRQTTSTAQALADFEKVVLSQKNIGGEEYTKEYFTGEWREDGFNYSLESRRKIEGKNPQNIKDTFHPKRVLDLGCGPGALMHLLTEIGVDCYGIDFSEGAKATATPQVKDRIHVGSVTDFHDFGAPFDLVVCRELLEHLTVLQIRQTVANMAKLTERFVYVTTRFHPNPKSLLDVTDDKQTDPTHITVLNIDFLRTLFVLEGMRRRPDLEDKLDWKKYGRVLVYEKVSP